MNRPFETLAGGRYVLADVLGAGGMGLVHRGRDEQLGRDVAVKILADNLSADADARQRFEREARAAARLNHPNVVAVFDVGEENGRPYFVMELVEGPSLADVLHQEGTLSAEEADRVARQTLAGLGHSHRAGLLHRDLKPGNLLRAPDGTIKVTDFGVAQATELPQLTRTGLVLGTLPYLAPERLAGAPATPATDLYALGATLLELLTGAPPDTRRDTQGEQVHGAGALDTVPPRLARFIERCLAIDPDQRPASVESAIDELAADGTLPPAPAPAPVAVQEQAAQTRVLAEEPTVVARSDGTAQLPDLSADDSPADATGATGQRDRPLRFAGATRWAVFVGLAMLVVLALGQLSGDGESETPPADAPAQQEAPAEGDQPAPDPGDGGGGDGDGDPADLMRDLGDEIRGVTGG